MFGEEIEFECIEHFKTNKVLTGIALKPSMVSSSFSNIWLEMSVVLKKFLLYGPTGTRKTPAKSRKGILPDYTL